MSLKDGSKLILGYAQDFSSPNLSATVYTEVSAALPANVTNVYIENTAGTAVSIAYGASGSERQADISPINNNVIKPLLLNAGMRIAIKSTNGTLSSGKFTICFYN